MKYLLALFIVVNINMDIDKKIIDSFLVDDNKSVIINYIEENQTKSVVQSKMNKDKEYRFFNFKEQKVYFDVDKKAIFNGDLCGLFTLDFKDSDKLYNHSPVVSLIFIVDNEGTIISKGFIRKDIAGYYNDYALKILSQINDKKAFLPAIVDGKTQSSIYTLSVHFSNLKCIEVSI